MSYLLQHHALMAAIATSNGLFPDANFRKPYLVASSSTFYDAWVTTNPSVWLQDASGAYTVNAGSSEYLFLDHSYPGGNTSYQLITYVTQLTGNLRIVGIQGDITVSAPGIYTQNFVTGYGVGLARFHLQCYQGTTCRVAKMILKTA